MEEEKEEDVDGIVQSSKAGAANGKKVVGEKPTTKHCS